MGIRPKRVVQDLKAYVPPLEGRRGLTRLDFNETTQPIVSTLPGGLSAEQASTYPEYETFRARLASHLGITTDQLLLTNGSDEALSVIAHTFIEPGQESALCCSPTFPMIPHSLALAGADLIRVGLTAERTYDLAAIEEVLSKQPVKLAMLASPDNPTGAMLTPQQVSQWCRRFPETLFVVDEAYSSFEPVEASCLPIVGKHANLIVTQTFSKSHGLAGFRLGYAVAAPKLVEWMSIVRSPYSISTPAIEAAESLFSYKTEIRQAADHANQRRDALMQQLQAKGFELHAGGGNFFLVNLGLDAGPFSSFAREQGLLVRDQSSKPTLQGWIRVSVGTEAEHQQLLDTLDLFYQQTALLFDLDDTLIDTSRSFDAVVAWLLRKYSEVPLGLNELQTLRAEGGFNDDWLSVQELLRRRNVDLSYETIAAEGTKQYLAIASDVEKPLFQEALFHQLGQRYRLFIMTGRYRPEYDQTWAEVFNPQFEAVYCMGDVPDAPGKPAPDYLKAIKAKYGVQQGYYIGNSVDDMRAARGARLTPIGVTQNQPAQALKSAGAATLISSVNDLPQLMGLPQ